MVIKIQPKLNGQKKASVAKSVTTGENPAKKIGGSIYNQAKGLSTKGKTGINSKGKSSSLEKALSLTGGANSVNSTDQSSTAIQQNKNINNNESILKEAKAAAETCDTFESTAKTGLTLLTPAGITEMTTPAAAASSTSSTDSVTSVTSSTAASDSHYDTAFSYYKIGSDLKSMAKTKFDNGDFEVAKTLYKEAQEWMEKAKEEAEKSSESKSKLLASDIDKSIADCKAQLHICEALINNACGKTSDSSSNKSCNGSNKTSNSSDSDDDKKKQSWGDVLKNGAIALGSALIAKAMNGNNPSQGATGSQIQNGTNMPGTVASQRAQGKNTITPVELNGLKNASEAEKLGLTNEVNAAKNEYYNLSGEFNKEGKSAADANIQAQAAFQELGQLRGIIQGYQGEHSKIMNDIKDAVDAINKEQQTVDKQTAIIEAQTKVKEEFTEKKTKVEEDIKQDEKSITSCENKKAELEEAKLNLEVLLYDPTLPKSDRVTLQSQYDIAKEKLEQAKAELKEAQESKKKHEAERDACEKAIETAESKIKAAEKIKKASEGKIKGELKTKLETAKKNENQLNVQEQAVMKKFEETNTKYTEKLKEKETHLENQIACQDRVAIVDEKLNNLIQKAKKESDCE